MRIIDQWQRALVRYAHYDRIAAVLIAVTVICLGIGLGWEGNKLIPLNPAQSAHYLQEPSNRLSFLSNWDGPIYLNLAQHGYTSRIQTNFFPLYPLTIHIHEFRTTSSVTEQPALAGCSV